MKTAEKNLMTAKPLKFRYLMYAVFLSGAIYHYCTVDREKALAWFERVAIKAATVYAEHKHGKLAQVPAPERRPASPEPALLPAAQPSTEAKSAILAKVPELKPGQTMKFHYRIEDLQIQKPVKEQTLEWELISTENKQFRWEDSDGTVETYSALQFLPPVSASGNYIRYKEKNVILGDVEGFFPLTRGKSMSYSIRLNDSQSYSLTCTVGQQTPVATPAGAFKTIEVNCNSGAPLYITEIFYYSPQLNHWVVHEREYAVNGNGFRLKAELTGFTFPDPNLRKPAAR